jgi:DNA-binding transcriptional regulator YiaG
MKRQSIKKILKEAEAMQSGKIAPGRVWRVTKRADGTFLREQADPESYRRERAAKTAGEEALALTARRKLGVSQDRFAEMLGISAGTLRNWEQKRRQPTGAAALLLRVAAQFPEIVGGVANIERGNAVPRSAA